MSSYRRRRGRSTITPMGEQDGLGRQLSELIGAVGIYLGDLGSAHEADRARLRRAMQRAMRSEAFVNFMEAE